MKHGLFLAGLFLLINTPAYCEHGCDVKSPKKLSEAVDKTFPLIDPSFWMKKPFPAEHGKVFVAVQYGKNKNPHSFVFSEEIDLTKGQAVEFNVDDSLPEKDRYTYRYKVQASIKQFAPQVDASQKFETDWIEGDTVSICLEPRLWKAPRTMDMEIDFSKLVDKNVDYAVLYIKYPSCKTGFTEGSNSVFYFGGKNTSQTKSIFVCSSDEKPEITFELVTVEGSSEKKVLSKVRLDVGKSDLTLNDKREVVVNTK